MKSTTSREHLVFHSNQQCCFQKQVYPQGTYSLGGQTKNTDHGQERVGTAASRVGWKGD